VLCSAAVLSRPWRSSRRPSRLPDTAISSSTPIYSTCDSPGRHSATCLSAPAIIPVRALALAKRLCWPLIGDASQVRHQDRRARCPRANDFQRVVEATCPPPGCCPRPPRAHRLAACPRSNQSARLDRAIQPQHYRRARRLQPTHTLLALCQSKRSGPRPGDYSGIDTLRLRPSTSAQPCQAGDARPSTR
jgi:hypothetical protein